MWPSWFVAVIVVPQLYLVVTDNDLQVHQIERRPELRMF